MKLLRMSIESTNRLLGYLKSHQRVDVPANMSNICINLGCGLAVMTGWINIDGSLNALVASMPKYLHGLMYMLTGAKQYYSKAEYCRLLEHEFIHHDLSKGIPLKDGVADYIYTSHFLEHLYKKDAISLLHECHRVLKSGGVVRISIPDLRYAISLYFSNKKDEMLQQYFFVENDGNQYSSHKYMYDFEMIKPLLMEAGFRKITRCSFQQGVVPDINVLDNRPEDSLFVEAEK